MQFNGPFSSEILVNPIPSRQNRPTWPVSWHNFSPTAAFRISALNLTGLHSSIWSAVTYGVHGSVKSGWANYILMNNFKILRGGYKNMKWAKKRFYIFSSNLFSIPNEPVCLIWAAFIISNSSYFFIFVKRIRGNPSVKFIIKINFDITSSTNVNWIT